jgi:hypothetical protein
LPPGTRINPATGVISGFPVRAGSFNRVVVRARNRAGNAEPLRFGIVVRPLPAGIQGAYSVIVGRDTALNGTLGGFGNLRVAASGAVSGSLRLGARSHGFRGNLDTPLGGPPDNREPGPAAMNVIVRRGPLPPVELDLILVESDWGMAMTGTATLLNPDDESSPGVLVQGANHPWNRQFTPRDFAGNHTVSLWLDEDENDDPALPRGRGFATVRVTAAGRVNWTGKLPDGIAFRGSSTLWGMGGFRVFAPLNRGTGSLHGTLQINPPAPNPEPAPANPPLRLILGGVTGAPPMTWFKPSTNTRAAPAEIGPASLLVLGSEFRPPDRDHPLLLGARRVPVGQTNARIGFELPGDLAATIQWAGQLAQDFRLTPAHRAEFSRDPQVNPAAVRITRINPGTGVFSGSLRLRDPNPDHLEPRTVNMQGVLLGDTQKAEGLALVPELSTPEVPRSRTKLRSIRVVLFPAGDD